MEFYLREALTRAKELEGTEAWRKLKNSGHADLIGWLAFRELKNRDEARRDQIEAEVERHIDLIENVPAPRESNFFLWSFAVAGWVAGVLSLALHCLE